ncbi:MAG TPA: hypothetical protein VH458_04985 [Vicinamibacterales bacterium]|jgi:hypothetical protein
MTLDRLPDLLDRGVALIIFGLGIGMVALHTALAALTARQPPARAGRVLPAAIVGAYLAAWFGLALTVGDHANFPLRAENLRLWLSLLVGFGPMVLGIVLLFASRTVGQLNASTPAPWLIWAQTYRVAGLMFLFPFLYYGIVPAAFAIPAALGDFVTGAFAPLVGRAVARRRPNAIRWATAWNIFGMLDLIVAPAAAILSQAQVLGLYPLSLIPLFLGPPLGILTHVYSLRNLATNSSTAVVEGSRPSPAIARGATAAASALRTT